MSIINLETCINGNSEDVKKYLEEYTNELEKEWSIIIETQKKELNENNERNNNLFNENSRLKTELAERKETIEPLCKPHFQEFVYEERLQKMIDTLNIVKSNILETSQVMEKLKENIKEYTPV
jgi:hypothetical protein